MPSNFEIAVLVLLVANLLTTVYYNYHSEEDYKFMTDAQRKATNKKM